MSDAENTNGVNVLRLVAEQPCDGVHPDTGRPCVLGEHKGFHQADDGRRWLDED